METEPSQNNESEDVSSESEEEQLSSPIKEPQQNEATQKR